MVLLGSAHAERFQIALGPAPLPVQMLQGRQDVLRAADQKLCQLLPSVVIGLACQLTHVELTQMPVCFGGVGGDFRAGQAAQFLGQGGHQSGAVFAGVAMNEQQAGRRVVHGPEDGRELIPGVVEVHPVEVGVRLTCRVHFTDFGVPLWQQRQVQLFQCSGNRGRVDLTLRPAPQVDDARDAARQQRSPPPPAQKRQVGAANEPWQGGTGVQGGVPIERSLHGSVWRPLLAASPPKTPDFRPGER